MNSKQWFVGLLVLVALAGAGVIVFSSNRRPSEAATRTISYTVAGQTQTASLTRVNVDAFEGARFVSGPATAPVTIVEFADYQCPACGTFSTQVESLFRTQFVETGKVRYAYRDFPLPNHANAMPTARAAACANEQGKFQAMHLMLYRAQSQWSESSLEVAQNQFKDYAGQLGLDVPQFDACQRSNRFDADIQRDLEAGRQAGLEGTPTFIINGYRVMGALPIEAFDAIIREVTSK